MYYKNKLHSSRNKLQGNSEYIEWYAWSNFNRKQISLSVNDVSLTGIQTVNNFNTYFTSVASDLVRNLSNNNNHPYGDNNLNAQCVLRETSQDEIKKVFRSFEGKRYHRDEI